MKLPKIFLDKVVAVKVLSYGFWSIFETSQPSSVLSWTISNRMIEEWRIYSYYGVIGVLKYVEDFGFQSVSTKWV